MTDFLRRFLEDELPQAGELDEEEDLLAPGMLDSLAIIRLVALLEETEGIVVEKADIAPTNLRDLKAIRAFVARKKVEG